MPDTAGSSSINKGIRREKFIDDSNVFGKYVYGFIYMILFKINVLGLDQIFAVIVPAQYQCEPEGYVGIGPGDIGVLLITIDRVRLPPVCDCELNCDHIA
jgi:hypothetical protein